MKKSKMKGLVRAQRTSQCIENEILYFLYQSPSNPMKWAIWRDGEWNASFVFRTEAGRKWEEGKRKCAEAACPRVFNSPIFSPLPPFSCRFPRFFKFSSEIRCPIETIKWQSPSPFPLPIAPPPPPHDTSMSQFSLPFLRQFSRRFSTEGAAVEETARFTLFAWLCLAF